MHRYSVFGGCLSSELELPELAASGSEVSSWTLELAASDAIPTHGALIGGVSDQPCSVQLLRLEPTGFVLTHSCTGVFAVEGRAGERIRYAPRDGAAPDLVRGDVLGRVLALAMHIDGHLSLHASAVTLSQGAVAFLGPKGFGKSTLAAGLVRGGARFLTDDSLPVVVRDRVFVEPGVQSLRLRGDSAGHLLDPQADVRTGIDGKLIAGPLASARIATGPSPLVALYVLTPVVAAPQGAAATRQRVSSWRAAMELVRHSKIGALLGGPEARLILERATSIASAVPLYALEISRDLDRLPEVVRQIVDWHGADRASRA
jgi:hypothetical protein